MDAVERFETLDGAMEYLMSQGDEDEGMFQTSAPSRQDSTPFGRQSSGGVRYVEPFEPHSDSEPTIHCDPNAEKSYLSLEELGHVLTGLTDILQCKCLSLLWHWYVHVYMYMYNAMSLSVMLGMSCSWCSHPKIFQYQDPKVWPPQPHCHPTRYS